MKKKLNKQHSTLLNIYPLQGKSMNHKYLFVNSTHDNEYLTKNRSETKKKRVSSPKHIFFKKNVSYTSAEFR